MFAAVAPFLFVLIWSTGFIVARGAAPHATLELFSFARMGLTALLFTALALLWRERWPRGRQLALHAGVGLLMPGLYLWFSWAAVARGMSPGIMSLLVSLTPLIVALLGSVAGFERLSRRGWSGLAVAAAGAAMVLAPAIGEGTHEVPWPIAVQALLSVLAIAVATLIQHRWLAHDPLQVAGAVQNGAGALVALFAIVVTGHQHWDNAPLLWVGLGWSVVVISTAALSLLGWMLRHRSAATVSALFLLAPPLAAVESWLLFGTALLPIQIAGFAAALAGVALARSGPRDIPEPA